MDYSSIVQGLDARQRQDLAVHLYSTFLLHRVDPRFPGQKWANWPDRRSPPLDPRVREDYEDVEEDQEDDDTRKKSKDDESKADESGTELQPVKDQESKDVSLNSDDSKDYDSKLRFFRASSGVTVNFKPRTKASSHSVLKSEIKVLLQRKIRRKLAQKGLSERSLDMESSPVIHQLSTRLASRLAGVLAKANKSRISKTINWQDVLISAFSNNVAEASDLASLRRSYEKCRRLFHSVNYKYQYDESFYPEGVPEFNMADHLDAVETQGSMSSEISAEELISARKADFESKEATFKMLWDTAARARQLSPKSVGTVPYEPRAGPQLTQRQKVFERVNLTEEDFLL